jgi:hypothetical protein
MWGEGCEDMGTTPGGNDLRVLEGTREWRQGEGLPGGVRCRQDAGQGEPGSGPSAPRSGGVVKRSALRRPSGRPQSGTDAGLVAAVE